MISLKMRAADTWIVSAALWYNKVLIVYKFIRKTIKWYPSRMLPDRNMNGWLFSSALIQAFWSDEWYLNRYLNRYRIDLSNVENLIRNNWDCRREGGSFDCIFYYQYLLSCFKLTNPVAFWCSREGYDILKQPSMLDTVWVEKTVICWCKSKIG